MKICYIADMPHHYRLAIFSRMAKNLDCDFYFGNKESNIKSINLNHLQRFRRWLDYKKIFKSTHYLKKSISTALRYDVVILLGDPHGLHNWLICLFFKILRKPVILWTHGWYGKESGLRAMLKLSLFKATRKLWVYGPRSKKLLIKKGIDESKIDVIYNSLDYNQMQETIKNSESKTKYTNPFNNDYPIVTYVGRVQPVKQLDMVINAISNLKKKGHHVNFMLIGEISDNTDLHSLVCKLQLESQVIFYGPSYNEETICDIFRQSSLCVSPGNVGLTAIHSLTYGCPVLTHDNLNLQMPEFESITPGVTGDFYEYGNLEDLTKKIQKWTNKSEEERITISEACKREVALRWNPENQINIMINSINELDNEQH